MFPRFIHAILHVSTSFLSMAKYYSALLQGIFIQKDQIQVSCTAGGFFTVWDTREAHCMDRPHFVYPFICGVAFSLAIMNNAATNIHIQVLMWTYISLGLIPRSRNAGSNDKTLVAQRCPTLCDPMDCKPTRFPVHGILQARILEWVAILSSRGSSEPRDQTQLSHIAGSFFTIWATREAHIYIYTAGSYRNSMLNLLRNLQTLPRCYNSFTFRTGSNFFMSSTLIIVCLFQNSHGNLLRFWLPFPWWPMTSFHVLYKPICLPSQNVLRIYALFQISRFASLVQKRLAGALSPSRSLQWACLPHSQSLGDRPTHSWLTSPTEPVTQLPDQRRMKEALIKYL